MKNLITYENTEKKMLTYKFRILKYETAKRVICELGDGESNLNRTADDSAYTQSHVVRKIYHKSRL